MITQHIQIMNLSCSGCVNTITRNLKAIEGVNSVNVALDTDVVTVNHENSVSRAELVQVLLSLGYPEENTSNSLITKLKSKKSCIIGRLS
jgi:copper chaperone